MKRDMELARKILFELETCESAWGPNGDFSIEGYSDQEVAYHVKMLYQAGLIEAQDASSMGADGFYWMPGSLTWQGHEFIEASRDDTRWNATKKKVQDAGGGIIFSVLKDALIEGAKSAIGL
jgi:hypothetical protein